MTYYINATVFTGNDWLTGASVGVGDGRIQAITTTTTEYDEETDTVVDLNDDYLIPGLIDLQLYGGSQLFLNEQPTAGTVRHIYDTHARNGTTTLLPTIHSTSLEVMQRAMAAVQVVRTENPLGIPGIHIEGPYFNPIKRGAHSAAYVRTPADCELETLFSTNADVIRILTLAPEILTPDQLETIKKLKHGDTLLSLGHSNATYQQASGMPLIMASRWPHIFTTPCGVLKVVSRGSLVRCSTTRPCGRASSPTTTTAIRPQFESPINCWAVSSF